MENEFIKKIVYAMLSILILLICSVLPEVSGFSGGSLVDASKYSYMVQVFMYDFDEEFERFVCGGALLKPNWVITAAHCIGKENSSYTVNAGLNEVAKEDEERLFVDEIVIHEKYNIHYLDDGKTKGVTVFDIALLKLDGEFNDKKYVLFPTPDIIMNSCVAELTMFLTGYGCKNEKYSCQDHIVTSLKRKSMKGVKNIQENIKALLNEDIKNGRVFFATNDEQPGIGAGDSGSPLVIESDGNFYIFGIVSFAALCNSKTPVTFTDVNYFRDWIETEINRTSPKDIPPY